MIFTIKDPLQRVIILKNQTWTLKVTKAHPETVIYLSEFKKLVCNPYYIVRDIIENEPGNRIVHPTREEYIDFIPSKTATKIIQIKAIVDHVTNPGEVVTLLVMSKPKVTTEGGIVYVRK